MAGQRVPLELSLVLPDGGTVTLKTTLIRGYTQAELHDQIDHLAELASKGAQVTDGAAGPGADAG